MPPLRVPSIQFHPAKVGYAAWIYDNCILISAKILIGSGQSYDIFSRREVSGKGFSLLMVDLDNFKTINDTYGHLTGDRVLVALVQKCKGMLRGDDTIARYGGEEFAIILPGASLRNSVKKGKQICQAIAGTRYAIDEGAPGDYLSVTVSVGVSTLHKGDTVAEVIDRADRALYHAKGTGKNRVVSERQL